MILNASLFRRRSVLQDRGMPCPVQDSVASRRYASYNPPEPAASACATAPRATRSPPFFTRPTTTPTPDHRIMSRTQNHRSDAVSRLYCPRSEAKGVMGEQVRIVHIFCTEASDGPMTPQLASPRDGPSDDIDERSGRP